MLSAFLWLIACQVAGELIREALNLPIPGPVIGMFVLMTILGWCSRKRRGASQPEPLDSLAAKLISSLGLLFVPAGVGIIGEADVLRAEWLPILAGVLGSTILSVGVTGLVMHWSIRHRDNVPDTSSGLIKQLAEQS